ncbi:hypothetical protein BC835DRAFT_1097792 [Cytidiella melzeri]|nr:hypothetical protein BC835DRAFT_1097792 [Cytidiella melzeri]
MPALYPLPTSDPTLPILEPTLHDQVEYTLKLKNTPSYSEKWAADVESLPLLKRSVMFKVDPRYCPTAKYWQEDGDLPVERPFSPVLSARARRETPGMRSTAGSARTTPLLSDLADRYHIQAVKDEEITEQEMPSLNDALRNRISVDAAVHAEMTILLKSTWNSTSRAGAQPAGSTPNAHCDSFIRSDSPSIELPEPISPPIFSRELLPGAGTTTKIASSSGLRDFAQLGLMIAPQVNSEKGNAQDFFASEDRYMHDMSFVDGWQTLRVPSSPTLSLENEVDELDPKWLVKSSSPPQHLFAEMMDEYELPRTEKIGRASKKPGLPGHDKRLDDFLSFLHPITSAPEHPLEPDVKIVTSPKSQPSSPHTFITASMSMLGQPPTMLAGLERDGSTNDRNDNDGSSAPDSDNSIGLRAVMNILGSEADEGASRTFDPSAFILRERLDENETLLMDVPDLPPPNIHSLSGPVVPIELRDLSEKTKANEVTDRSPLIGFLKQVKGFQSLYLELSWRPFDVVCKMPTHEEVAQLLEPLERDCMAALANEETTSNNKIESKLTNLLAVADLDPAISISSEKWLDEDAYTLRYTLYEEAETELVLTAAERRRLYGQPELVHHSDDVGGECDLAEEPGLHNGSRKRQRHSLPLPDQQELGFSGNPIYSEDRSFYSQYIQDDHDSGQYWTQHVANDAEGEFQTNYYELASGVCGFDGAGSDIQQSLADVDPIYLDNSAPFVSDTLNDYGGCIAPGLLHATLPVPALDSRAMDAALISPRTFSPVQCSPYDALSLPIPRVLPEHPNGKKRTLSAARNIGNTETALPQPLPVSSMSRFGSPDSGFAQNPLEEFMTLRAKKFNVSMDITVAPPTLPEDTAVPPFRPTSFEVPKELMDSTMPDAFEQPAQANSWHRYLGSLQIIQKLGITRALTSPSCKIQLVERESLNGAEIIIDPHTAVILSPLGDLVSQCDLLTARMNQLSWRFSRILVVFEVVPFTGSDASANPLTVNPFSPLLVKAVKKLRRDLEIAEACLDKQEGTRVHFAFPMSAYAAARTIRRLGDMCFADDTSNGLLWDDRLWLDPEDEDLDEHDLAALDGMNVFIAAVILSRHSLDGFLERTPEQRAKEFGGLIGVDRINAFNKLIARRIEAMQLPSSSPPTASADTSNPLTPLQGLYDSSSNHNLHC